MLDLLKLAGKIALPTTDNDMRHFWLGCVGIRNDGVLVSARNGAVEHSETIKHYQRLPGAHAEGRVLKKLGHGGTLYVARIARQDRSYKLSLPCQTCMVRIKSFGVTKVWFTINPTQYGLWDVRRDTHRVFNV